jgi:hypothetical protein
MKSNVVLLLNLAVLVVNFVVAVGVSESQNRTLRATARVAYASPPARRPAPEIPRVARAPDVGPVPRARLVKYLGKLRRIDRLSAAQIAAVHGGLADSVRVLDELGGQLARPARDGAAARELIGSGQQRIRHRVAERLRRAALPEDDFFDQLVRIVISSAG